MEMALQSRWYSMLRGRDLLPDGLQDAEGLIQVVLA